GCEAIVVDYDEGLFRVGGKVVHRGDFVSIDGSSGEVFEGRIPTIDPDFQKETDLQTLFGGRTKSVASRSGRTPTIRATRSAPGLSAPKGSAWTGPNTCSWRWIGSPSSTK